MKGLRWRAAAVPTAATLILVLLFANLGLWQLHRAAEKTELIERFEAQGREAAVRLEATPRSLEGLRYRRVLAQGRFLGDRQLLLDNQVVGGAVGFRVITPLLLDGSKIALLVDRGWVPMGKTRQDLPRVELSDDEAVRVSGRLSAPPQTGWRLGPPASPGDESWPRVVQYLDLAWIRSALGVQVLDQVLLLDPQEPFGFRREWTPVPFGPERHLGYALQWFSLAVAVVVTYLWLSLRPADRSRGGEEDGDAR